MECSCASAHVDILYAYVYTTDEMVSKALGLTEIARIARHELRLGEYLLSKWRVRAKEASTLAGQAVAQGGTVDAACAIVDTTMAKWAKDVRVPYANTLASVYKLARAAGHKKATGRTKASLQYVLPEQLVQKAKAPAKTPEVAMAFDLQDTKAIAALQQQEMMWIGEHYGANVASSIRDGVAPAMAGLGRAEAGRAVARVVSERLKDIRVPGGWNGSDAAYFEGLAANAVTNARVQGQLESFARVKVVAYQIVNPMDSRTTPICEAMNGTIIKVSDGMGQLGKLRGAKSPEDVKSAHPWVSSKVAAAAKGKGSKALAAAGLAFPPYHFRCRSTVDIATGYESYEVDG